MEKKVIVLYGIECADLCLYLTRIFIALGKTVSVVDHTDSEVLGYCIPGFQYIDYTDYRGVHFYKNIEENTLYGEYDVIISYRGFCENLDITGEEKDVYYIVDQLPCHIDKLKKLIHSVDRQVSFVYKDYVDCKINDRTIDMILNVSKDHMKYSYIVPFDYDDYEMNLIAQFNSVYRFEKLSPDFRRLLLDIVCEFFEEKIQEKVIRKQMKKAGKGA
jgi:hypothetical protein